MFNAFKTILTGAKKVAVVADTAEIDRLKKQSSKLENDELSGLDSINHKNQAVLVSQDAPSEAPSQGRNHWPQMKKSGNDLANGLCGRAAKMPGNSRYQAMCAQQAALQSLAGNCYGWERG